MSFDITLSIYSRFTVQSPAPEKSEVIEEILCEARRQKRSIVDLCEHFGDRRTRAKRAHKNDFLIFLNGSFITPKNASPKMLLDILEVPSSRSVKMMDSSRRR